ncbi:DUF4135 domain-containing protein [Francisella sp. SYW-9]|uniref:DUF4135 domain-containing protein n=1 Tax=Francisella sp. SYW-9 TaxID=2610888 RepID=UPI00123CA817|nr:DUF4135 domain-containing protein [Francisella sp. SYW-9]
MRKELLEALLKNRLYTLAINNDWRNSELLEKYNKKFSYYYSNEVLGEFSNISLINILGDSHDFKATLHIRTCDADFIYKPTNGYNHIFLNRIYSLLNEKYFNFIKYPIIGYSEKYHKADYISNENIKDICDFSYHYGALLFLAYTFRFVDIHSENVIIKDSKPIICDVETMCLPIIENTYKYDLHCTSLLPNKAKITSSDISFKSPIDNIKISNKHFKDGIDKCYVSFIQNKDQILQLFNDFKNNMTFRLIVRPTRYYFRVIENYLINKKLAINNSIRYKYLLDSLYGEHQLIKSFHKYEIIDCNSLNIPYFTYDIDCNISHKGKVLPKPDYLFSCYEHILKSMENLDTIRLEILRTCNHL